MGAGRQRIVRQLLTESLVLSALGSAAALVLAAYGAQALVRWASAAGDWRLPLGFEWRHIAFTAGIAVAATCLFALSPAWAASRIDLHCALQSSAGAQAAGRFRNRVGRGLIVAQLSVSLVLLSSATLLVQSLWNLRHQNFGFDARVLNANVPLEFTKSMMKQHTALRQPLYERMNAIPGVRSAAVSAFGLMGSTVHTCNLSTAERPSQPGDFTRLVHVSEGYFETIGTPILAGRGITAADRADAPKVVVVSQMAARALYGKENALGRFLSTGRKFETKDALQVVGVASDVRFANPREPFGFVLYVPLTQDPAPVTAVLVRGE